MSSLGKGIYLQLLSRLLKNQEEVVESASPSSSSSPPIAATSKPGNTRVKSRPSSSANRRSTVGSRPLSATHSSSSVLPRQYTQADNVLRSAFHRFKVGDHIGAHKAIKKLLTKATPAGPIHFSAQLCLSLGHLRMKEYEEVIKALSDVISLCGQNVNGLCDALVILSEAYSAVGLQEEALHSARLAVDVAHDKLEAQQKPEVVHVKSIILLSSSNNNSRMQLGPMLDIPTALVTAYYTLASQLLKSGYLVHAVEWYSRAAATSRDFRLDDRTCKYLNRVKESAVSALNSKDKPVQDRISNSRRNYKINRGEREFDEDVRARPSMSAEGESEVQGKFHVDMGKQGEENFDDDDVPIDEDDSDNVDEEIDATLEENASNFYKSRHSGVAAGDPGANSYRMHTQTAEVMDTGLVSKQSNTNNQSNAFNNDKIMSATHEINRERSPLAANLTKPLTPDVSNRPSKSKRISSAKFRDKMRRSMKENRNIDKENAPVPKIPWRPSGVFNPNAKSPSEVAKEEVRMIKINLTTAAKDTYGMTLDELFDKIDVGNNKRILVSELEVEVKCLLPNISRIQLRKFAESVNETYDGSLDKQDFLRFILEGKNESNNNDVTGGKEKGSKMSTLSKQRSYGNFTRPKLVRTRSLPLFDDGDDEKQAHEKRNNRKDAKSGDRTLQSNVREKDKYEMGSTISTVDSYRSGNNIATDSILNQQSVHLGAEDVENDNLNDSRNKYVKNMKNSSKWTSNYAIDNTGATKIYSDQSTCNVVKIQAISRGYIAKKRVRAIRQHKKFERRRKLMKIACVKIQKIGRGYIGRKTFEKRRKLVNSVTITKKANHRGITEMTGNVSDCTDNTAKQSICEGNSHMLAEEMSELLALREQMRKHKEENPEHFFSPMQHKFGAFGTTRELDPANLVTIMPPTPVLKATSNTSATDEDESLHSSPKTASVHPVSSRVSMNRSVDHDESSLVVEPPTPTKLTVQDGYVVRVDAKHEENSPVCDQDNLSETLESTTSDKERSCVENSLRASIDSEDIGVGNEVIVNFTDVSLTGNRENGTIEVNKGGKDSSAEVGHAPTCKESNVLRKGYKAAAADAKEEEDSSNEIKNNEDGSVPETKSCGEGVSSQSSDGVVPLHYLAVGENKILTADEMRKEFDADMHTAVQQFGITTISGSSSSASQDVLISAPLDSVNTMLSPQVKANEQKVQQEVINNEEMVCESVLKTKGNSKKRGVMFADNIEDVKVIPNTVIGEEEAQSLKEIASKKKNNVNTSRQGDKEIDEDSSLASGNSNVIGSPPLTRRGEKSRGTIISSTLLSPVSSTASSRHDPLTSSGSIPTQQEKREFSDESDICNNGEGEDNEAFADDESSAFYTDNSDYYYDESMTPNTLTTYGENTPVGFEKEDGISELQNSQDLLIDANMKSFATSGEREVQNNHF